MDAKNRPVGQSIERELLYRAAKADKKVFIEAFWKIRVPDGRPRLMKLWPAQKDVLDWYDEPGDRFISLKARQLGWTTTTTAYAFHTTWFRDHLPWLFVSQNEDYAKKNLGFVRFGYQQLPEWVRERGPKMEVFNSEMMELSNGSRIESIPATGSSGRGDAVWGVMWDEVAHAPDPINQLAAITPLVYGKLLMLSTANGMGNLFQATYSDSKEPGSVWKSKFIGWRERPERDDAWYDKQLRENRGQLWVVHQEHPNNDMEAFVKSGRTPIGYDLLEEFEWIQPESKWGWDGEQFVEASIEDLDDYACVMEVWEEPTVERDPDHGYALRPPNYVLGVDLSEGHADGDATSIAVYDANNRKTVARVETHFPLEEVADVIAWIGHFYHTALIGVERNQAGWGILNWLDTIINYPRLYRMTPIATTKKRKTAVLGWHTNAATKPKMVRDYARWMRAHEIEPLDPRLRSQLMTFVQDDSGKYGASGGNHDDVVIAHMIAAQVMDDVHRFPVLWRDMSNPVLTMADFDELAFGGARRAPLRIGSPTSRPTVRKSFMVFPRAETESRSR